MNTALITALVLSLLSVKFVVIQKFLVGAATAAVYQGAVITFVDMVLLAAWTAFLLHVCVYSRRVIDTREFGLIPNHTDAVKKQIVVANSPNLPV